MTGIREAVRQAWVGILGADAGTGRWDVEGGDQQKLLRCIAEIEGALGRELRPDAFHVGMSPDDMVRAIAPGRADSAADYPPGGGLPVLFLLPGSIGYGPSLASFAASMGRVARVVPVRYPRLQMILAGQDTVADMASAAATQIERTQPSGDVRLLGHSLGGAVAFEVAARLLAAGRSVRFLGILDTSSVGERRARRKTAARVLRQIRIDRVNASRTACRALAKGAVAMGCEAGLARLLDLATRGRFNATGHRIRLELQETLRAKAFFAWLADPRPMLPISGTLFRCERDRMPQALGWDRAFAHLTVVPVAGGHTDLVTGPHLATNRPLIEAAVVGSYAPADGPERRAHPPRDRARDVLVLRA